MLAAWLAARVNRPLAALAEKTAAIDLDRLDQDFSTDRTDEIGALSRLLGAMTDRLRTGAARLRDAERRVAMGDLARQVNHDIKNGLGPIRHVLRHLDEVARTEPAALAGVLAERKGTLDSSLSYLDTLARNYAGLSPALRREPCDVNAVVQDVASGSPPGRVKTVLDPGLPPATADRLVLRRIIENLVGNAVDGVAGRAGDMVTVSTERAARDGETLVRVVVADTGPGMSREQLDRAFDDFFTTKEGGTGLGLSIVRRLVLDLGGALRIETEPGAGTRAIVDLPATGEIAAMTLVMIVDDVPAMAEQYAYDLKRLRGYEVIAESDGRRALERLGGEAVDCIILDLEMPGMDGFEVLRALEKRGSEVPVIVYTGTGNFDRCIQAMRLGAAGFIDKAEPMERVVHEIESAIGRRRLRAEVDALERRLEGESSLVGTSAPMVRLKEMIARVAPVPSTVLVTGESGTGKELVARDLHRLGASPAGRSWRSTARRCRTRSSRASCSATSGVRSPAPRSRGRARSSRRRRGRSFWTRSVSCRSPRRPSCCACWRSGR